MLGIGTIIWISVRPLIRLILCAGFGFAITKADIFPTVASRAAGQIILKITLPCLMFSKIVPAFSTSNIGTLGPLFLVAFIYEGMGLLLAWIVKQFFWVPHRFRYGILVAGGWGNYADLPTSVIMSVTAGPPFNSSTDPNIAVAYVSAFIFVFFVTLFPFGGNRMIAWDYVGPEVEDEEMREATRLKRELILGCWKYLPSMLTRRHPQSVPSAAVMEYTLGKPPTPDEKTLPPTVCPTPTHDCLPECSPALGIHTSSPSHTPFTSRPTSPSPSLTHADSTTQVADTLPSSTTLKAVRFASPSPPPPRPPRARLLRALRTFAAGLLSPASLSVLLAFPLALITPLKALLVAVPHSPIPNAPDGQPPLAFVLDTAAFVGAASVPLGLLCLGAALARLRVPRGAWRTLPLGAIGALALAKTVLSPVLGVLLCAGLTRAGVIDRGDKVLRFVCMFFSCLPTATTQVYLTQVYSGTGSAEHISAFLIPQYALMIVMMTILTAYSINVLF